MTEERGESSDSNERIAISSKKLLGDLTHRKIDYYLSKNHTDEGDLYSVFKEFFKELLDIKKEFTCSELLEKLETVFLENETRKQTNSFIEKISEIEYKDNAFNDEQVRTLFKELDDIVVTIIKFTSEKPRKSFFQMLFGGHSKKEEPEETIPVEAKSPSEALEKITTGAKKKKEKKVKEEPSPPTSHEDENSIVKETGMDELDQQLEVSKLSEKEKPSDKDLNWSDELNKDPPTRTKYEAPPKEWTAPVKEKKEKTIKDLEDTLEPQEKPKEETKEEKKKPKGNITKLIAQAKKLRKKEKIQELYEQILELYNDLDDDKQDKYYDDIQIVYEKAQK